MDKNIEIEKKYIILLPGEKELSSMENYEKSHITQIYLSSEAGVTHRVRSRERSGKVTYTETKKIRIDKCSSFEDEREITEGEFFELCKKARADSLPVKKVRHTFLYLGQLFEIDVYPAWKNTAILETELESREQVVKFPEFLKIVREVTGERAYSNASMAKSFPEKDKIHL